MSSVKSPSAVAIADPEKQRVTEATDGLDNLTPEEELLLKSYLRKTDLRLAIFICFGYITSFLNKSAISYAKIDGFEQQLNMHGTQYNTLLGLSTAVFLVFQVPLNFLFRKLGARKYMPTTLFLSGCLSALVLVVKNFGGFLAIRLIEGVFLSGFTCSVFYSLSLWYPRKYLVTRVSWVIASSCISGIIYAAMAIAFSYVHSKHFYSWQWMYFLFGLLAIASGIYGYVFVSDYPDTAAYLTVEEQELIGRILRTTHMITSDKSAISRKQVIQGLTDWRLMVFMVMDFCNNYASSTAINWAPIILKSVGYSTTVTAALMLIPAILAFIMIMSANYFVRALGKIGYFQIIMSIMSTVVILIGVAGAHNKIARTVSVCLLPIFTGSAVVVGPAWLNVNQRGADRSALSNGFAIVATSLGGTANGYAYLNSDAPLYIKGNSSNFAMTGLAIICTVILMINFSRENRKRDQNPVDVSHLTPEEIAALGNDSPTFRYTL
ncbi:hypothetical protein FBU59_000111 [Linderina macrospora]|uniref:Uncharacterized protein n=1 Tax=Linderina macrospora TaxID=4868 RepID=A0ACC1JI30_9FUNG|nr:hypothetical protein FBU59_000111 [Linderina macrospora]